MPRDTGGIEADGESVACKREFVNRTRELERLRVVLDGLRRGTPARLLIEGEGGIGKSRLLAEAILGAERPGIATFMGRAVDFERERSFGVLVDALGLHGHSDDATAAAIGTLVLWARDPGRPEERHDLIPRIVSLIDRLCRTQPVALVLEDMQWADPMSVITVLKTLEDLADRPLGLFMTLRALPRNPAIDDLIERARPEFERISLDGLESHDTWALVRSLTGGEPGPQLARLLTGTAGNPSMVIALINGLREIDALRLTGGVAETDAALPPPSMWSPVMARIARHSDSCQDLLTLAAVFGGPIAIATLAVSADRSVFDVLTALREAIAGGILAEVDGVLRFRHELVRSILFEKTPASLRSELQRRIAEVVPPATWRAPSAGPRLMLEGAPGPAEVALLGVPVGWERATPSERKVVWYVVDGLSNREIGKLLFVSARTVETHLSHVYAKLGVSSRVELTGVVMRNSILRAGLAADHTLPPKGTRLGAHTGVD